MKVLDMDKILKISKEELINTSEKEYDMQINSLVNDILLKKKRIVLLSGPSGSGKTTTAKRIVKRLQEIGYSSIYLSMDNWFRTKSSYTLPLNEEGKPDYESPLCVDIDLLNEDMKELLGGKEINLPTFDFVSETMCYNDETLKLKDLNSIIVLEGLHTLNDYVDIDRKFSYRVFVCPEDICIKNNVEIFQQEIRLYRRINRDKLHRGRTLDKTVELFNSVCRGEELYLKPYLKDIDFNLNSFMDYEIFLHNTVLYGYGKLKNIPKYQVKIEDIPCDSIMTEFYI